MIRISLEQRPSGPAENALILIELREDRRARYISWIGYYDLDEARRIEPGRWELVEPPRLCHHRVTWMPFGWSGMTPVPGDSM